MNRLTNIWIGDCESAIDYLESLESQLMFVDCAGILHELKLFTNQSFSPRAYIDAWRDVIPNTWFGRNWWMLYTSPLGSFTMHSIHLAAQTDWFQTGLVRWNVSRRRGYCLMNEKLTENEQILTRKVEKWPVEHWIRLNYRPKNTTGSQISKHRFIEPVMNFSETLSMYSIGEPDMESLLETAMPTHVQKETVRLEQAPDWGNTHTNNTDFLQKN